MSSQPTASSTASSAVNNKSSKSASNNDPTIAIIDAALDRLNAHLPEQPYFLNVPSWDLPYSKTQYDLDLEQSRWLRQIPAFSAKDAHRQYSSFLFRDHIDTVFDIRTYAEENGELTGSKAHANGGSKSGMIGKKDDGGKGSSSGAAKKKISLAAYKEKKERGYTSETKQSPDVDDRPAPKVNGISKDVRDSSREYRDKTKQERKRKSPEPDVDEKPTPSKKTKHSMPAQTSKPDHGLPPMLSPIKDESYGLPPMLSPTLPPEIEEALRKRRERADSDLSSLSDVRSSTQITPVKADKKLVEQQKRPPTSSPEVRRTNKLDIGDRIDKADIVEIVEKAETAEKTTPKIPTKRALDTDSEDERPLKKTRLLVKLRYGKRRRKDVERILRLPSRGTRLGSAFSAVEKKPVKKDSEEERKISRPLSPMRASSGSLTKPFTSRPPEESPKKSSVTKDMAGSKKPKPSPLVNGTASHKVDNEPPSTPIKEEHDSRKAQHLVTPKEMATAMARTISANSRLSTPRNLTPHPPGRPGTADRGQKVTGITNAKSMQLADWSRSYNGHGRKLKHQAEAIPTNSPRSALKRKAVSLLQSIMSYMLAYTFNDVRSRARGLVEDYAASWSTLIPLLNHAKTVTRDFTELEGVRCYLAYVVSNRAVINMISHIAAISQPSSSTSQQPNTPVGGASAAAASPDPPPTDSRLPVKIRNAATETRNLLADAKAKLPITAIMRLFPDTWSKAEWHMRDLAQDGAARETAEAMLEGKGIKGPFYLPVDELTTGPQAVRFALAVCEEWMRKEGLEEVGPMKLSDVAEQGK